MRSGATAVTSNVRVRAAAGRGARRPAVSPEASTRQARVGDRAATGKLHDGAEPRHPDGRHVSSPTAARSVDASAGKLSVSGSPRPHSARISARLRGSESPAADGAPGFAVVGRTPPSSRYPIQATPAGTKGERRTANEQLDAIDRAPPRRPVATNGRVASGRPLIAAALSRRKANDRLSPTPERTPTRPRRAHDAAAPCTDRENAPGPVRDAAGPPAPQRSAPARTGRPNSRLGRVPTPTPRWAGGVRQRTICAARRVHDAPAQDRRRFFSQGDGTAPTDPCRCPRG